MTSKNIDFDHVCHLQVIFLFVHVIVTYEYITFIQWGNFDRGPRLF